MPRGVNNTINGADHHAARLTGDVVRQLRTLHYDRGVCIKCAATLAGVRYQTAYEAICFLTWKHVR